MHSILNKLREDKTLANTPNRKISIIGCGRVGVACGFIFLLQKISNHIVFFDKIKKKLEGEIRDFQPYSVYFGNATVEGTIDDYTKLTDSRICILVAGTRILPGENKMDILQRNIEILREIIPRIRTYCPDCIIIVVTNPIDLITYFAWKMSKFPANRVFGIGHLYSKSFQHEVAHHLNVSAQILNAWIVGEYGDSGVSLWSSVNIAGARISDVNPQFGTNQDVDKSYEVHKQLLNIPHKTTVLKGYSSWSPGFCIAQIVRSILDDKNEIYSASVLAKGVGHIEKNIFLSLPCVIGRGGATSFILPRFLPDEAKKFDKSADVIDKKLKKCTFWTVNSPAI